MNSTSSPGRVSVDVQLEPDDLQAALRRDAARGLTARPKWTSPMWFYDERGSELYEEITRQPEYYPFRVERDLLLGNAPAIAGLAEAQVLVELGSGTSEKTRALLSAMEAAPAGLRSYVGLDVSREHLVAAATGLAEDYGIEVHAVMGDFLSHLDAVPPAAGPRLVAFLGSTIGNLDPAQRHRFLGDVAGVLAPHDSFLLATDLVKPVDRLVAAYDDAAGVTAAFNRNVLAVLNRELDARFDLTTFHHVARWNAEAGCVEIGLESHRDQQVPVPALDMTVDFVAGEEIRTEISTKFTRDQVARELGEAGLGVTATWTDPAGDYLLTLARRAPDG